MKKKSTISLENVNISFLVIENWTGNYPHEMPGARGFTGSWRKIRQKRGLYLKTQTPACPQMYPSPYFHSRNQTNMAS